MIKFYALSPPKNSSYYISTLSKKIKTSPAMIKKDHLVQSQEYLCWAVQSEVVL